jgi:uncharacterized Zn finger protein (UPF0148 family)
MFSLYGIDMKKENCPFCGHRWIRKSSESPVKCPNCKTEYSLQTKQESMENEENIEEEETISERIEERDL